jgi:hypothetical protein
MEFFAPPTALVLYSDLDPEECEHRLCKSIDVEQGTFFSLSRYRGSKPFVGAIKRRQIRILQRKYGRNAFPPVFTGELQAQGPGTKIIGMFDLEVKSKIALCLLSAFTIVVLIPIVTHSLEPYPFRSVLFACFFIALAFCYPRIVRGDGVIKEKNIANFLRITLKAGDAPSASAGRRG